MAAACTRQGAVVERLPGRRLPATRFAAGAANHLLPSGLGAGAVDLRFVTVCGVPPARSSAAPALYLLAESVGRVVLLGALLLALPGALRLGALLPEGFLGPLPLRGVAVLVGAVVVLALACRVRRAVTGFLRTALGEARSVHSRPARALALWGGSPAFPALRATALVLVGRALGAAGAGRPHGAGLSGGDRGGRAGAHAGRHRLGRGGAGRGAGGGGPAAVATAVVLAYRIITVWLPLLPGALTLGRWSG
ncbi:membrane protein [Streptomyces griseoviridis]|uniref:Membrane protein n=1 Tax=Streptomyces griseoviridis TaxID=45398 RepID=A0A918LD07_STRGD|nr:membrane protein [Streptomyces niveoruber]